MRRAVVTVSEAKIMVWCCLAGKRERWNTSSWNGSFSL
jgi:hypothetical protein